MNPVLRDYQSDLISRLEEMKPPLTIWTKYAQMMKYKPGWAFYRWQEQQQGMAA